MTLDELFRDFPRIVVTGGPITGKTIVTDARPDGVRLFHSDDIVDVDDPDDKMREKARTVIKLVDGVDRYIVAGVAAHVALKYGIPADCIVVCTKFHGEEPQKRGQKVLSAQAEKRSRIEAKKRFIPLIPFRGRGDYRSDGLKV